MTSLPRASIWKVPVAAGSVLLVWALIVGASGVGAAGATSSTIGLGTAGDASVLAGAGVTNTGPSVVDLDLDTSPTKTITGFPPGQVLGAEHAGGAVAARAQQDLETAYATAKAAPSTASVTGVDLGGKTLTQGVYSASSGLALNGPLPLTLDGGPTSVFIFKAGTSLISGSDTSVVLTGGARACNVFWQVGSSATLGTGTAFVGTILALTSITLGHGSTVAGRALAQNGAVTLDSNVFTTPPPCASAPPPTTTSTSTSTTVPTTSTTVPTTSTTTTTTTSTTVPTTSTTDPTTSTTVPTTSTTVPTSSTTVPTSSTTSPTTTVPTSSTTSPRSTTTTLPTVDTTTTTSDLAGGSGGQSDSFTPGSGSAVLATTGTDAEGLSLGGAALIGVGTIILLLGRRRRT